MKMEELVQETISVRHGITEISIELNILDDIENPQHGKRKLFLERLDEK
jgi:hypothetical protein